MIGFKFLLFFETSIYFIYLPNLKSPLSIILSNKSLISAHEAVCEERYNTIVTMFERFESRMDKIETNLTEIREMATQGRASLKTLLWIGGLTAGIISLLSMIIPYFR